METMEPVAKKPRVDESVSPMATLTRIREELQRTTDRHLQARLLVEYSEHAAAPGAQTEAAIDFLFSFLQQNQAASVGSKDDGAKADGGNATGSSAVVVGAIVRGLRGLLAVKASVVEPMIQIEAMSEQLMQCITVAEEFKLRRDMLQIVLECLLIAKRYSEAERLVSVCVLDHDAGLRGISLEGYLRLIEANYRLVPDNVRSLYEMMKTNLHAHEEPKIGVLSARLLGVLANVYADVELRSSATFEVNEDSSGAESLSIQSGVAYTLATAAWSASVQVRREIAIGLRQCRSLADDVVTHLLQKKQIQEDLSDLEAQSAAMMSSGALLTLLEDEDVEVALETTRTIRTLCVKRTWSSPLIDRILSAHMELLARVPSLPEAQLEALETMELLLTIRKELTEGEYAITREEMEFFLGSIPDNQLQVVNFALPILALFDLSSTHVATRVVELVLRLPSEPIQSISVPTRLIVSRLQVIVSKLRGLVGIPVELTDKVESTVSSSSKRSLRVDCCQVLLEALRPGAAQHPVPIKSEVRDGYTTGVSFLKNIKSIAPTATNRFGVYVEPLVEQLREILAELKRKIERLSPARVAGPFSNRPITRLREQFLTLTQRSSAILVRCNATLTPSARSQLLQLAYVGQLGRLAVASSDQEQHEKIQRALIELKSYVRQLSADDTLSVRISTVQSTLEVEAVLFEWLGGLSVDGLRQQITNPQTPLRAANAEIIYPDASESRDVNSQHPTDLRICFTLQCLDDVSQVVVKICLPHGETVYTRVRRSECRVVSPSSYEVETTVRVRFAPFSDPTSFTLQICIDNSFFSLISSETLTEGDKYVEISPVVKYIVHHRTNANARHPSRQG